VILLVLLVILLQSAPSDSLSSLKRVPIPKMVATTTTAPSSVEDVDRIVTNVAAKAEEWKAVPVDKKVELLQQILKNTIREHDTWCALAQESRGVHPTDPRHGCARADIIVTGPAMFGSYLNGLISTLQHCSKHDGVPPPPRSVRKIEGIHKSVATLWPRTFLDYTESVGLKGELVLDDETPEQFSLEETCIGGVAGILGAGNIDAPTDILCQMFLKGRVCVFKPNPVNEKQHTVVAGKILEPLIRAGYLAYVCGGNDVGAALVKDSRMDEIVLTGSMSTYEAIKPLVKDIERTPICAELGGVNPWIVVPGKAWNARSIDQHARHLAFSRMSNNGHTCVGPQVVLVAKDWPWRREFFGRVRFWLGQHAGSPPFYPGSDKTHSYFSTVPKAEVIIDGEDAFDKQQRPILISNVLVTTDEENQKDTNSVLTREAFCPVLAEVPIDYTIGSNDATKYDSMAYLRSAIQYTERNCFGSLSANILIPDEEVRKHSKELDRIICEMPFGIVGVNLFPGFAYSLPMLIWGAPPGQPQSGIGFLGNAHGYKHPQKAVLRAPFQWLGRRALCIMSPQKTEKVMVRLGKYKMSPGLFTQLKLFAALFLGI
jgi:hypothetical protein